MAITVSAVSARRKEKTESDGWGPRGRERGKKTVCWAETDRWGHAGSEREGEK